MAADLSPFSTIPNPNSLYLTDSLRAVVIKARYVVDSRQGLTCIIGDIGFGKSTILRFLYSEYDSRPDTVTTLITMPNFPSAFSMLKSISEDFEIESARSMQTQQRKFQQFLVEQLAQEKNVVIFIDEAQDLKTKHLELIRALLNFETNTQKLIQFVIAGQVELQSILNRRVNKPLKSRIITTSTLAPLTLSEAREMIQKRCEYSAIENPFSSEVLTAIHDKGLGVPRSILKICGFLHKMDSMGGFPEGIPVSYVETSMGDVAL